MGSAILMLELFLCLTVYAASEEFEFSSAKSSSHRRVIDVKGGPESLVWVVQLSDLHFSVHHPDRALDFKNLVGPALSMINPSLVLITGDLTGFYFYFFLPFPFDSISLFCFADLASCMSKISCYVWIFFPSTQDSGLCYM